MGAVRVDWRLPEHRMEAFVRVTHARMAEGDLDQYHAGRTICDMLGLNRDQRTVYAMIFGHCYKNCWCNVASQLWPDLLHTPVNEISYWHDRNWRRMKYGNDAKWNVRKFPKFVDTLQKIHQKTGSLHDWLAEAATGGTTRQNYQRLNKRIRSIYSMGRMTTWLAMQTLYEFFHWDIDLWDAQLYDASTWSTLDGILYILGKEELATRRKGKPARTASKRTVDIAERGLIDIMETLNSRLPFHVDIYNIESCACDWKKTAYGPEIKEFTYLTTTEQSDEWAEITGRWDGHEPAIDHGPLAAGLMCKGPNVRNYCRHGYDPRAKRAFYDHGYHLNTHHIYHDEPDAHVELGLRAQPNHGQITLARFWDERYTKAEQEQLYREHDPARGLLWKAKDHPGWENGADYSYAGYRRTDG
jgi:hypothetical protein